MAPCYEKLKNWKICASIWITALPNNLSADLNLRNAGSGLQGALESWNSSFASGFAPKPAQINL